MKKILPLALLLLLTWQAQSQSMKVGLTGQIMDAVENAPLPGAYLHLTHLPDSTTRVVSTDKEGKFSFREITPGRYLLKVSFMGYLPYTRNLLVGDQAVDVGALKMKLATSQLQEVVIEGKVQAAEIRGDTIVYNAAAFKTNDNANADELIEKLPGVTIEDGKVQAEGQDVTRVTVDGRTFFGDDAISTLRNLPADIIDQIEVYDRSSDQAELSGVDDGERFKSINIVTKVNMRHGTFGRVYAGAGNDNRYMLGGNMNIFQGGRRVTVLGQSNNINQQNFSSEDFLGVAGGAGNRGGGARGGGGGRGGRGGGGGGGGGGGNVGDFLVNQRNGISKTNALGLNYNDYWGKNLDVSGSYYLTRISNLTFRNQNREYIIPANLGQIDASQSRSTSRDYEHRFNFRLNYKLSPRTTLRATPTLSIQQNRGVSTSSTNSVRGERLLNDNTNRFETSLFGLNFNNSLLFSHRFAKPGRSVSLNLGTGFNNQEGDNFLFSRNLSPTLQDSINQSAILASAGWRLSANLSLTERISSRSTALFTYNASYQYSDSDKRNFSFFEPMQAYTLLDTALSNSFNNGYITQRVGPGYRYNHQKIQFNAQVAYQTAVLDRAQQFPRAYDFARTFTNVVPTATFRYRFRPRQDLSFTYRTNTNAPSVNQMQEVYTISDPLHVRTGNPDLAQTYQHNLSLRYVTAKPEASRVFSATLTGNIVNNYITNSTQIASAPIEITPTFTLPQGGQITRPLNLQGSQSLRGNLTYGMPLALIKSKINFNFNSGYARTPGLVDNALNFNENINLNLGTTIGSNISKDLDFTVSSRSGYTIILNSLRGNLANNRIFNQNTNLRFRWVFWNGMIMEHNANHRYNGGMGPGFNASVLRWNASVGTTVFKDKRGEIKLTAYDLLNQNTNISRSVGDLYIQDVETLAMTRYVMVSFNYNFRKFGSGPQGPTGRPTNEAGANPRERQRGEGNFRGGGNR